MPSAGWGTQRIHSLRGASSETRDGQTWTREALWDSWSRLGFCKLKHEGLNWGTRFCSGFQKEECGESQWLMKAFLFVTLKVTLWLQRDGTQKEFYLWQVCVFPFLLGSKNSCFPKLLFINNLLLINYLFLISSKIKEITSRQKSIQTHTHKRIYLHLYMYIYILKSNIYLCKY